MSDTNSTVPADVNITGKDGKVYTFKGRIPDPENLAKKIKRIYRICARAGKLAEMLPDLEAKYKLVSDPAFRTKLEMQREATVEKRADRAESLLASLPADVRAAILEKMSGK